MEFDFSKEPGRVLKRKTVQEKGNALISIVTPFYNAGTYFKQTWRSVINQTFPWFEWVIVDDGSDCKKDLELLEQLAGKDARIVLIHQNNKGLANARNAGIRCARTDLIVPLDADDLLAPQYLEYTFFGLYFHPQASWCYTDTVGFGQQQYLWRYPWNAKRLKRYNYLTATAAIRRQAWEAAGGYRKEKQHYYEDWRFWLQLLEKHQHPVHVKGYLFWYRRLEHGMLSGIRTDQRQQQFCKKLIAQAAKKADSRVRAVEYPVTRTMEPYYKPRQIDCLVNEQEKQLRHSDKIRILMMVPWMVMGGADRFNLDLVSGLDQKRFQISIVTTAVSEHEWQGYFSKYTDEIFHLPDFLDPVHAVEYVSFHILTRRIQVVFLSNSYRGYYMLPYLRKQFPKLCIIDYVHMEEWYWKAGGFARLSGIFGSFLDKTYVSSSAVKKVLVKEFCRDDERVEILYIGVDTDRFDPNKVRTGRLYQALGVSKKVPIVLFPCRIDAQKRPFFMLAAAKLLIKRMPEVIFAVVGDGPQRQELERAIRRYGLKNHVICIGQMEHMEECYQDAKLTLICSIKEGLSLTAYESCAMGTPVVSSDVGGQKDLIDASVGRLIPMRQKEASDFDSRRFLKTCEKKEIADYVRAMEQLLADTQLYERCSANCRKKIRDGFSTSQMLKNIERELNYLVSEESRLHRDEEMHLWINRMGDLAEEICTLETAEEERSTASAALLLLMEQAASFLLPQGSRRRNLAVDVYKKYRSKH